MRGARWHSVGHMSNACAAQEWTGVAYIAQARTKSTSEPMTSARCGHGVGAFASVLTSSTMPSACHVAANADKRRTKITGNNVMESLSTMCVPGK
jgi:hypothetical protein